MTKKIGLVVLSFMLMFALAACGGNSANSTNSAQQSETPNSSSAPAEASTDELTPEPGAKLVFWHPKTPFSEYAVQEFEKKFNIPVTLQDVGYDAILNKYKADGPAGKGADVFVLGSLDLGDAVKSGSVLPNDYFEEDTKNMMLEEAIKSFTWDGILYGYPSYAYLPAIFINKDLVKDAKFETWDDIKAFAKQFNDVKNNKFGFFFEANSKDSAYPFMAAEGGYYFGKDGTDANDIGINNEGAVKGLEYFQSLKEILPLKAADASVGVKTSLWEEGKVAMIMDGTWNSGRFKQLPFKVESMPLPNLPDGKMAPVMTGVGGFFVGSYTQYPNAAKLFANFLMSEEMQMKINEVTGFLPLAKNLQNEELYKDDPVTLGFIRQLKQSHFYPIIPEMKVLAYNDTIFTPAIEQIWDGADVKTSLDKAAQSLKDSIAGSQ
ncbi:extracellular solute-binding protein [Paenibacillus sp. 7124]|uniref:Extracellular solute-binding protein n=1 Tax=Paenibacillus apii TaxID=1850370 RepID=A0A6M1PJE4_9BACL|nr:extracellular solute-binding protein [Paenibacillus apii]NGM82482.1 extracellular solute-binding protein [Paenibacillus apii]